MFETPADIRVNTVNCVGIMGAGVALAFKNRYPAMFREYKRECAAGNIRPGALHVWRELDQWVINFPTKRHWKEKSRYEDIESGLVALREYLLKAGPVKLALPALGCGHGGLDWNVVSDMIRRHLDGLEAEIIVFDPADSHTVARKGPVATPSKPLRAGDREFPDKLARVGIKELAYAGENPAHEWDCDVAVFLSSKPDEKESQAAADCVADLSGPGIRIALVLGSALSNKLASVVLDNGGSVIGWVPEGLDRYKTPKVLAPAAEQSRLRIVSIAKPHHAWNPGFVAQSSAAALALSRAALFLDPAPKWLGQLASGDFAEDLSRLFHIRYQNASQSIVRRWQELQARAIGRRSSDGRPNLDPIREAIGIADAPEVAKVAPEPVNVVREDPAPYRISQTSSMTPSYPKRLIEVDLPIRRISAHARREKSIRHGHISTLHIWWARRPLAACRAVICASLWPDPADPLCPQAFISAAKKEMRAWTTHERQSLLSAESRARFVPARTKPAVFDDLVTLRAALLDFIADFANWDNSTKPDFLETSRALTEAAHVALGGEPGTRPLVVDPFAGGGSIPLEALRVGADAFASDLNPIPVLLNKVVLEYIPKYGQRLADEVRKWGEWIKEEAEKELAKFYPRDPDGATPIAYLWARTIQCEGPGCGAEVPLIRSLWLARKPHRTVALKITPNIDAKRVDFRLIHKDKKGWLDDSNKTIEVRNVDFEGTIKRGSATCPCCGYTTPVARVRAQLFERSGGAEDARLMCVVTTQEDSSGRSYRVPNETDYSVVKSAADELTRRQTNSTAALSIIPEEDLPIKGTLGFRIQNYGILKWRHVFAARQALTLSVLSELVKKAGNLASQDVSEELASVTQGVLGLSLNRLIGRLNSLCWWRSQADQEKIEVSFSGQTIPMKWDFAEACPLTDGTAGWDDSYGPPLRIIESLISLGSRSGSAFQVDASNHILPNDAASAFVTDPPYYDAVPYAALSDFFYVWLKRTLPTSLAGIFSESLAPKNGECIVDPATGKDRAYFETLMVRAMAEGRRILTPSGVGVVVFAHKSTSGWETQLQAMVDAGWIVTGSWPIDTEQGQRIRARDSAALASSVHLVCRPRENTDGSVQTSEIGDWRDVLQELPKRIHEWMPRLAEEGVVGADAIFACLGPALEVFSRYSRVEKASGDVVTLKEYLEHVWAAVSKEALSVIFKDADTEGFEPDSRLTAMWLWTLAGPGDEAAGGDDEDEDSDEDEGTAKKGKKKGGFGLEYDAARKIAQGLGAHLEDLRSMVEVSGETARLLPVAERMAYLFGKEQAEEVLQPKRKKKDFIQQDLFAELAQEGVSEQVWTEKTVSKMGETTLDRVHQSMILFAASRGEALKRFLVDDGAGKDQKFWRLAQALSALYPPKCEEKRWVDGVLTRKKGLGF